MNVFKGTMVIDRSVMTYLESMTGSEGAGWLCYLFVVVLQCTD